MRKIAAFSNCSQLPRRLVARSLPRPACRKIASKPCVQVLTKCWPIRPSLLKRAKRISILRLCQVRACRRSSLKLSQRPNPLLIGCNKSSVALKRIRVANMAHSNRDPALRASVAIASRILNAEGILDYSGHVSVRAPGREAYFIQAGSDPRSELEPDRLLLVDFDGRVVEGDGKPPIEAAIHGEIYRQRADVEAVLHSHM
ncbi:MAG: class II aldolase/adducin family protein, partial [Alphaproteobacteria bacterium]|nr:class II aldolase/adducin family protein [Alphaproteobacteria bacterium]